MARNYNSWFLECATFVFAFGSVVAERNNFTLCQNYHALSFESDPLFERSCESVLVAARMCTIDTRCEFFSFNDGSAHFFAANPDASDEDCQLFGTGSTFQYVPSPFTLVGAKFYYQPNIVFKSVDRAKEACAFYGGKLAEFNSMEELELALNFMFASAYVGIRFTSLNTEYRWETSQTAVLGSMWAPREPFGNYNCVQLSKTTTRLDDIICNKPKTALCQKV